MKVFGASWKWRKVPSKGGKIFCVGRNKTGTKSLSQALIQLGYKVADQRQGELLMDDWFNRDFRRIVEFCRKGGDAFQDVPFSLPFTYVVMDQYFPGSKFILTMRDNPEQWYNSLVRFHSEKFSPGRTPAKDDLMAAQYVEPGWMWKSRSMIYTAPETDPYNQQILMDHYIRYNESVIEYFRNRKDDLLILNPSEPDAFQKLSKFLGSNKEILKPFPWKNRSGTEGGDKTKSKQGGRLA